MASVITNALKGRLMGDNAQIATAINLNSDTVKVMFVTSTYTPNIDTDVFITAASANEVAASGTYSAGGVTLTKSSSTNDTTDVGIFDASDSSVTTFTGTFRYGVVYKDTGTPSTSPIICVVDFTGADVSATAGTVTITWASGGILSLA